MAGSPTQRLDLPGQTPMRNSVAPAENEIAIVVNLDRPIPEQLEIAKAAAKEAQIERYGKTLGARQHPLKWPTYLQVIDARAFGASWSQIGEVLPDHMASQTPQDARRVHEQASDLMFNF